MRLPPLIILCVVLAVMPVLCAYKPHKAMAYAATDACVRSEPQQEALALKDASEPERAALDRLLRDPSWPKRAIAVLRLERYRCPESRDLLIARLSDPAWQVRAFATRSLARRRIPQGEAWFATEDEPRVIRTALRYRYTIDPERLGRGVRFLCRSDDLAYKMLAAELGAASGVAELQEQARDAAKLVILRMNRVEAGLFTPRLALLTGEGSLKRDFQWSNWLLKKGRGFQVFPAYAIEPGEQSLEMSQFAKLDEEPFVALEDYMAKLGQRQIDLAICLDCTASMYGELAAAQAGIDDMMRFVGDMVGSLRVGLVAYRDRGDEFETKGWDFTNDVNALRAQLWQLSAEGGGDSPESVYNALRMALKDFAWRDESVKVLVLVGDAPPHVGHGAHCVSVIEQARAGSQLVAHAIQAEGKEVKHFPEIAKAGGGKCVSLEDDDKLMAEITGLTLGDRYEDEFREFFNVYLEVCR